MANRFKTEINEANNINNNTSGPQHIYENYPPGEM